MWLHSQYVRCINSQGILAFDLVTRLEGLVTICYGSMTSEQPPTKCTYLISGQSAWREHLPNHNLSDGAYVFNVMRDSHDIQIICD